MRAKSNEGSKKPGGIKLNSNIMNMTGGGKIIGNHNFQNNYQSLCGTLNPGQTLKNGNSHSKDRGPVKMDQLSLSSEVKVGNGVPKTTTAASLKNYSNIRHAQYFDFGGSSKANTTTIKPNNNSKPLNSYLNPSGSLVSKSNKPYSEISGLRTTKCPST